MSFLDTHRFDHLTEDEVLRRIGELLAIAIGRRNERQRLNALEFQATAIPVATVKSAPLDPARLVDGALEQQIIAHLHKVGTVTPRELAAVLGLTKRTVTRKLARLRTAGLCSVDGKTRMACYRLRTEFGDN